MADADKVVDFNAHRPGGALFRSADEMASMRIEQAARHLPADSPVRQLLRRAEAPSPIAAALAPPHLGAYAPDPDADYERGREAGWREAIAEQLLSQISERRWTPVEQAVRFVIFIGLPAALFAWLIWLPRS